MAHECSTTLWSKRLKYVAKYNQSVKLSKFIGTYFSNTSLVNRVHLKSFNCLHAVIRAKEPREGILGHQTVDPLLSFAECVHRWRIHDTQQSFTGLSIQVYLECQKQKSIKEALPFVLSVVVSSPTALSLAARFSLTSSGASGLIN